MVNITHEAYLQMQRNIEIKRIKTNGIIETPKKKLGRPNLKEEQEKLHDYGNGRIKINIKPLSVNLAWAGKRFKTPAYKKYERDVLKLLPEIKLPPNPYFLYLKFGFSNSASDIDNPVKNFVDLLQKHYKFNDKAIYKIIIEKEVVKKGDEFIVFKIETLR